MEKVVVTGGCGFIGANLVHLLYSNGCEPVVFDNFSKSSPENIGSCENIAIIQGDVRDTEALIAACKGGDAIVHLAASGSVVESIEDPVTNFRNNVEGTFSVLNAARAACVPKVIVASTGGALIGDAVPPVNELSVPRPISPYGASKLAGEGYCCAFANVYGMQITALRFANVVGPKSWHKRGAISMFFKAIMEKKPIEIYGDGSASRDFLYVEDLCRGIFLALKKNTPGFHVYHLASGVETTIAQLAKLICEVAGASQTSIVFHPARAGEVNRNFASYDLAHAALGFTPEVSLRDGLAATWLWMQDYLSKKQ